MPYDHHNEPCDVPSPFDDSVPCRNREPLQVYEAYQTDDGGRGVHRGTLAFRSTEAGAQKVTGRLGHHYHNIKARWAVMVNGKVYLLQDEKPIDLDGPSTLDVEEIRKRALSKLDDNEKRALGLE